MQVTFTDLLRGQNGRSKVSLSYLGVRKKVANWYLPFKGFKGKNTLGMIYLKVKNYIWPKKRYLKVKKQNA